MFRSVCKRAHCTRYTPLGSLRRLQVMCWVSRGRVRTAQRMLLGDNDIASDRECCAVGHNEDASGERLDAPVTPPYFNPS